MADLTYTIEIMVLPEEMDEDVKEEILASAEPHDNDGGLRRYLGGHVNDAEEYLGSLLPDGFLVKISEVRP